MTPTIGIGSLETNSQIRRDETIARRQKLMAQETILTLNKLKYLKWSIALIVICVTLYMADTPPDRPHGGTPLGYTLGTIGALLIIWLMLFGMRKRAYHSNLGSVRGWLSAHVYLGLSLGVVATLHTGFQFGWNIHTLSYALTILVIVSGLWGVVLYLRHPALMSNLLNGKTLQEHGKVLRDLDMQCIKLAKSHPAEIQALVTASAQTAMFSSSWRRFTGKEPDCATSIAVKILEQKNNETEANLREIYTLQFRRLRQLAMIRQYVKIKSWTQIWLFFHVPLSFALLAALIAHIVSVFFYW